MGIAVYKVGLKMLSRNLHMVSIIIAYTLCTFIFLLSTPSKSTAGEWVRLENPNAKCDFRFSGVILPGDLVNFIDELNDHGFRARVCLNSEGGSFGEVYNFIKLIYSEGQRVVLSTRINKNDRCLSSCALLFMFGLDMGANSPFPSRQMEPGGRLGFHSPFISPKVKGNIEASDAFTVAIQVSKLLIDSAYKSLTTMGPAFPPEILSIILGTPQGEMYYVSSIGELDLLGIEMIPEPERSVAVGHHREEIIGITQRICASSYILSNRSHFVDEGYSYSDILQQIDRVELSETEIHHLAFDKENKNSGVEITAMLSGPYYVPGWYSAGAVLFCQVNLSTVYKNPYFIVENYDVTFGGPHFDWDSRLANRSDVSQYGVRAGLIPVETEFK